MEVGLNLKIGRAAMKPATKREADLVQIQVQPMEEKIVLEMIMKLNFVQTKVVYIWSKIPELWDRSRDLSQAELWLFCWSLCFLRRLQKLMKSSLSTWRYVVNVKSTVKISSIFVAFLENTNFTFWQYCTNSLFWPTLCVVSHAISPVLSGSKNG